MKNRRASQRMPKIGFLAMMKMLLGWKLLVREGGGVQWGPDRSGAAMTKSLKR
jgi:hypothetical protein